MIAGDLAAKDLAGHCKASSPGERSGDFAIVVGIDDYPDFRSLNGAVADARRFKDWLCDPAGGGVAPDCVRLVTSTPHPRPNQTHIDDELETLLEEVDRRRGGRRLYFYFSGHGAAARDAVENVALLLADWSRKRANLALSSKSYANELASYGLFEELVVFLDCCRTEPVLVGRGMTLTPAQRTERTTTRTFIAYATEVGHSAWEARSDTGGWHGVFTRSLLEILRSAPDGITATALKDRLESKVKRERLPQRAHIYNGLSSASRFGCSGTLPQLVVHVSADRAGPIRLTDNHHQEVATHDPQSGPWSLCLPAGLYRLQDATGRTRLIDHPEGQPVAF